MKKSSGWQWAVAIGSMALMLFTFVMVGALRQYQMEHNPIALVGLWDILIPLIPVFIIPYASMLILGPIITPLMSFFYGSFKKFLVSVYAIVMAQIFATFVYLVLPSTRPRDYIFPENLTVIDRILYFVYKFGSLIQDFIHPNEVAPITSGYATFPSGHAILVAISILAWLRLRHRFPILAPFVIAWSVLIFFSTLFVHEHYITEVYIGLLIGGLSYYLTSLIIDKLLPNTK